MKRKTAEEIERERQIRINKEKAETLDEILSCSFGRGIGKTHIMCNGLKNSNGIAVVRDMVEAKRLSALYDIPIKQFVGMRDARKLKGLHVPVVADPDVWVELVSAKIRDVIAEVLSKK